VSFVIGSGEKGLPQKVADILTAAPERRLLSTLLFAIAALGCA
jgi:hypothetical protein